SPRQMNSKRLLVRNTSTKVGASVWPVPESAHDPGLSITLPEQRAFHLREADGPSRPAPDRQPTSGREAVRARAPPSREGFSPIARPSHPTPRLIPRPNRVGQRVDSRTDGCHTSNATHKVA